MRIALVSPYDYAYPGGVTVHISRLRDHFVRWGHQVTIVAPSSKPAEAIAEEGVVVCGRPVSVPASGSIARITLSLRLSARVKTILREGQFDIVHLHEPLMPMLPITFLRFSEAINVGTFHANADRSRAYFYGRPILKRWFRKLHGKIAVSEPAKEFVSRYFAGYYNIIPNGIDVAHFSGPVPPAEGCGDGRPTILFVGRMEPRKGLRYLLRAYVQVKREMPDARLIIVGPDGPESRARRGYQRFVTSQGVQDVIFAGYVPYQDLPRYYQSADVSCTPATGFESQGYVVLEALAAGTPVVASAIDGYAKVITHGQEGLLVPPKDPQALALALVHLLADKELRKEMGHHARQRAQEFSWDRVARSVLAYYERLLNEVRSPVAVGQEGLPQGVRTEAIIERAEP